jgi:Raf kinase inhibitor-like YbhB/YbcL family protein
MKVDSTAFSDNGMIPERYTCDGRNISPELHIDGVPDRAKSLALVLEDPDAPSGTFIHWTMWNIRPQTHTIGENGVPPGATEGTTSARKQGYTGPCPPSGTHHYRFKVYALDTELDLPAAATVEQLEKKIQAHQVDFAELTGLYSRK